MENILFSIVIPTYNREETMKDLFQKYDVKGALIHSDQGSTYRAYEYRDLLK